MPFKPIRLLVAYDPAGGRCEKVIPRMKQLLEERAFEVDVHPLGQGEVDLEPYRGVVIGVPVRGMALGSFTPSDLVRDWITNTEGLDEKKVALFCVFDARPGDVFDKLKNLLFERGSDVVVEYPYWNLRIEDGEDQLPAECMVRIR